MKGEHRNPVAADMSFGVNSFYSVVITVHNIRENVAVHRSTTELAGSSHRFYITRPLQ